MTASKSLLVGILLLGVIGLGAFEAREQAQAEKPKPTGAAAPERAIRVLDANWAKAVAAKDVEKNVAFYAEDASALWPGMPIATGKAAIRKAWSGLFSTPGYVSLTFGPTKIDVSKSLDMAYEIGTYEMVTKAEDGQPKSEKGKYVVVWQRQKGGAWKIAADVDNPDQ